MRALLDVPAPAKLNLFLHVVGRRADGLHLLQSVFMLIDWCDTLHFELHHDGSVSREDVGAPLPPDDLIVRAARALQQATGCAQGVHVATEKRIPTQAGMGGGSSDAATTLLALNRLWGLNRSRQELAAIGAALGADVPFFLYGSHAWVEGTGVPTEPVELPPARFIVVKPPVGLDTGRVFRGTDALAGAAPATISGFRTAPYEFGRNDLQPIAGQFCPQIDAALDWLSQQGLSGRMTGSGSAVFARLTQDADARIPDTLPADWSARLCSNLAAHPLRGWARE